MEIKTYALSPQGISEIRQRFLQRMGVFFGILFLMVVGINFWVTHIPIGVTIIVFIVMMAFTLFRGLNQNKKIWESIRVEITNEYIAREQIRIPQIRINRQEITSIEEIEGGICIRTADQSKTLAIPSSLDSNDYQEIKEILSSWSPIQPKSSKSKTQNAILFVILIIGFGILFLSWSLWFVLIAGGSLTIYYAYNYWSVRQATGVDPRFRRSMLISFLFPLFIMIMKVFFLSGGIDLLTKSQ